ncbi:MAG TPA: hypothetical protein VFP59_01485 [Candidatus Angelobacter sp.]|nr:hypothetical protein [Candidatus Angelobacter sp.]
MKKRAQSGVALLLCLFALLLLSAIGIFLYMSSATETHISTNYGSKLDAYYAAKSGLQEVRDRVSYTSAPNQPAGGLADRLPKDIAGNPHGVLYIVNSSGGENVNPADPSNRYFDDQLCHDYNSGAATGAKCDAAPVAADWALTQQNSLQPAGTLSALKWVRINMKTNRAMLPNYCVGQSCNTAPLDAPVCWDGKTEQLSPGGALPACDANGMQNVYMLTALAVTPGLPANSARTLLRSEVVAPSIRPPGAITMDAVGSAPTFGDGTNIPSTVVDGRSHNMDGTLATNGRCSSVAALATDNTTSTSQLQQQLNVLRQDIVASANASCNWDGSSKSGKNCTPGLWWVRGTGSSPRFMTYTSSSGSSGGPGPSGDGDNRFTSGSGSGSSLCDSSTANCYTYLNLSSPELLAVSASYGSPVPTVTLPGNLPPDQAPGLFTGGPGNQTPGSIYQSSMTATLPNEVSLVSALVAASQGQANYFPVSSASLAASYGTSSSPAIVRITDGSLILQNRSLSGYGVLVVPNDLEVDSGGALQWTGIVLIQAGNILSGTGTGAQFQVTAGGTGYIRGALLLQPGTATQPGSTSSSLVSTTTPPPCDPASTTPCLPAFQVSYSCDAIDLAFSSLPFKIIGSSEISF